MNIMYINVYLMSHRLVFSWLFDICGNLENAKEKPK